MPTIHVIGAGLAGCEAALQAAEAGARVILYEMLTGKVPFDRTTSVNILMAHVHEEAPPMHRMNELISVSSAMEAVVAGCMAKDPERRFRSMD